MRKITSTPLRWTLGIAGGALVGVAYSFVSQALGST
jgi:hypothetical protein